MPRYLPIEKESIKQRPDISAVPIQDQQLIFRVRWNEIAEAFFFDLFTEEGEAILYGRRIVYAQDMLANVVDDRLPGVRIMPLDPSGQADKTGITFSNFMESIKPWIKPGDD